MCLSEPCIAHGHCQGAAASDWRCVFFNTTLLARFAPHRDWRWLHAMQRLADTSNATHNCFVPISTENEAASIRILICSGSLEVSGMNYGRAGLYLLVEGRG